MDNIFSGLESMGLGKIKNLDLYGDTAEEEKKPEVKKAEPPKINEADYIFDKTFTCPICDKEFKSKLVKTGKARLIAQDIDLRPKYADIDGLKYGVVVCPICGYATMARTFGGLSSVQMKMIREQIAVSFTGLGPEKPVYSYDDAISRHQLALINTVVKRGKISERAYLCLLLAWLTRGKRENLPEDTPNRSVVTEDLKIKEKDFLEKARDGLMEAFTKESFPLCGLDEHTSIYVIAALCAETGMQEESLRWGSRLIGSTTANDRIKERARVLKEMINNGEI